MPGQTTVLETKEAPWRIAGEVLRTYIICESEDGSVWLIDKHAAHERMNFDRLKNAQEPPMRQTLLAPIAAELSREDGALLLENLPLLEQFGFACEDFGGGRPAGAGGAGGHRRRRHGAPRWRSLPERLRTGRSPDEKREALLHTMACKAAIKGGWVSDPAELRVLVDRVQSGEIRYCPHGRPGGGEADEVRAGEDVQAGVRLRRGTASPRPPPTPVTSVTGVCARGAQVNGFSAGTRPAEND